MRFLILFSVVMASTLLFPTLGGRPQSLFPLRLHSDGGELSVQIRSCDSWRLAVETDNVGIWKVVPPKCVSYVAEYMDGPVLQILPVLHTQYQEDCNMVAEYIQQHLLNTNPAGNGKDIWIFDLGETLLSNLPYYRRPDVQYGAIRFNKTKFYEWVATGEVPGLEPFVGLYQTVLERGFKTVIISGTYDEYRYDREANLNKVGIFGWEKLILRTRDERGIPAVDYKTKKREELVEEGYNIVVNIGDQWSDLDGANPGERIFKVPNPMYYVD